MIPNPYLILGAVLAIIAAFGSGYYKGYSDEHEKFLAFQAQVKAVGEKAQEHNDSIAKQHEIVTDGIKNEYEAQLAAVRSHYANGVQHTNSSSSNVPSVSKPTTGASCPAPDTGLIGRCAETTAQLNALQSWIRKQEEIANVGK